MNENNSKFILAITLSFVFLIAYSYFFQPKPENKAQQITQNAPSAQGQATGLSSHTAPSTLEQALQPTQNTPIIASVRSKGVEIEIDSLGRIAQVYLKDKKFTAHRQEGFLEHVKELLGWAKAKPPLEKLPLLGVDSLKPLELRFLDNGLNVEAFKTPYTASAKEISLNNTPQSLVLTQELNNLTLTKTLTFYPNLTYDLKIHIQPKGALNTAYVLSNGARPVADADGYAFHGVLLGTQDHKLEKIEDGKAKETQTFKATTFIASVDRYYTSLFFANTPLDAIVDTQPSKDPLPFVSLKGDASLHGYIGPKDHRLLAQISPALTDVIEYGIITFFARPVFLLLDFLHNYTHNWGWAIILLTLIVRIILYPLSYKGMVSMQKIKDLAPKMKELQEKYKSDPQKLQMHMMQLYKKHGANPLGGCLPLLLQIPVFFAIYRVLYNAVELKSAGWMLWIHDLSFMDPYFILPLLMGVSMYAQQALTPSTITDPTQAKIFKMLPLFFTIFLITFPAGLVLYWTTNNIFSIIQQWVINQMLDKKKAREIAEHKHRS
ncbi:membrane protein insertase YidC [Helicobacter ailurogastricus]|uniref:Membrane protein insertase YidC n=1 Tax=Helicobacter ailurogastricus TaxID=1578720 RepID=A0A0K2X339_9HELI|nr:membrane protein insertase YidC [Helicobacter ailurogastricus]CRF40457.1 Inner membrane protein translocase component YidC, long form [Helicobacter ailurogastricus]CRF43430.1 Inner membrane protein translocase component YidC, long form [Helicobacter ailurogastricus]CRF43983.1 Inner membrane protein translocase component YidC, long form [Helicobacter ailurogastricus]